MQKGYKYSYVSVLLFLIAMYTIGTISAMIESWVVTTFFLLLSVVVAFLVKGHKRAIVTPIAFAWIMVVVVCLLSTLYGIRTSGVIFYCICAVYLLCSSFIDTSSLYKNMRVLKLAGIFFALGCYWQYNFPEQYYSLLFPKFGPSNYESITRQFTYHKMCTGFTNQTVVSAQFIIMGIMAIIYCDWSQRNRKGERHWLSMIELAILFGGLLLTGKRSPLVNIIGAYFITDLCTVKRNKRFSRIIVLGATVCLVVLAAVYIAPLFSDTESRNSLVRLLEASSQLEEGDDLSNGRLFLAAIAISYFLDSPIMGIGWGRFAALNDITGVHNIYLQLLCECGVVGFTVVVGALLFILRKSIVLLKEAFRRKEATLLSLMRCSVFIQCYILIYGVFGNPIYDQNYLLMYIYGLIISSSVYSSLKKQAAILAGA